MADKARLTREDYIDSAMDDYPLPAKALLAILVCLVGAISKLLWFWHIEDSERMREDGQSHLIIMNHVSFLETLIPTVHMWFHGHHVHPVYKSEFDENPFLGWVLPRVGGIPVDRGTADIRAVKRVAACLKRGESVLVFPEGTRIHDDKPAEVHHGYAVMARMAKAPVLPMAVSGIQGIKATGGALIWPFSSVKFKVGCCLRYEDFKDAGSRREQTEALGIAGMEAVYVLRDELAGNPKATSSHILMPEEPHGADV